MTAATVHAQQAGGQLILRVRTSPYLRKWLVLGAVIGVVAGLGAAAFYALLRLATHLLLTDIGGYRPAQSIGRGAYRAASGFSRPWAVPLVVALGGLIAGLLVLTFAPEAEGHGTDAAISAVHNNPKGVRVRMILVKFLASAITLGSGGSGGREGPTAQISSGFGSLIARALRLSDDDARICVAAGIASGVGSIFRAPFGGALLGMELPYIYDVAIEALIPSLVASIVGYGIFCATTGSYTPVFGNQHAATVHLAGLALFVPVGLICGGVGLLYAGVLHKAADRFAAWRIPKRAKPALGGLAVGAIGLAIPGVLGTSYGELQTQLFLHRLLSMPWLIVALLPFAKLLTTGLTVGSGGSAGIFGPGIVVGGATGALLWRLAHLVGLGGGYQIAFVIVGMAACFASISHAPLAITLMVTEMTGSLNVLPEATVAVMFAMLVVGSRTLYRSQPKRRGDPSPGPDSLPAGASFTARISGDGLRPRGVATFHVGHDRRARKPDPCGPARTGPADRDREQVRTVGCHQHAAVREPGGVRAETKEPDRSLPAGQRRTEDL